MKRRIRLWLGIFVFGLVASGVTAFLLASEARLLERLVGPGTNLGAALPALADWVHEVSAGLTETQARYPFIAYGTDWLGFAHLVIAVAFVGPWRDPVRNVWVVQFGIVACVLVIPLALLFGPLRGIPWCWRVIDCSFGVFGALPLVACYRWIRRLERMALPDSRKGRA